MSRSSICVIKLLMKNRLESYRGTCETAMRRAALEQGGTYRVIVERGVDTAMPLDLVARTNESTHLPPPRQGNLQRLEPIGIWVAGLIVCSAEGLERANDEVMYLPIIIIFQET